MTGFANLNLEFPFILAISVFMSSLNFMLSRVEQEKSFITSELGCLLDLRRVCMQVVSEL